MIVIYEIFFNFLNYFFSQKQFSIENNNDFKNVLAEENKKIEENTPKNDNNQNQSSNEEKVFDDYDIFKQPPKNSFINAINYNNYFFGNSNPRDLKKEDFEVNIFFPYYLFIKLNLKNLIKN